ncbi:MAG: hypothetical protein ACREJB_13325, partial [Planctomycetaceae bacterium]
MTGGNTSADRAAILGNSQSLFTRQLALEWKRRGLDVVVITHARDGDAELAEQVTVIRSHQFRPPWMRWARGVNLVLRPLERQTPKWFRRRYRKRTGRAQPEAWEWYWVDHFW